MIWRRFLGGAGFWLKSGVKAGVRRALVRRALSTALSRWRLVLANKRGKSGCPVLLVLLSPFFWLKAGVRRFFKSGVKMGVRRFLWASQVRQFAPKNPSFLPHQANEIKVLCYKS